MRMESCDKAPDEAELHEEREGCESVRLLQALDAEPTNDGGAQVGGANQAARVSVVPLADSRKRDERGRGGRSRCDGHPSRI